MVYDIPGRAGIAIATDTLIRLAEHPRIVALKDAKADFRRPPACWPTPTWTSTPATTD